MAEAENQYSNYRRIFLCVGTAGMREKTKIVLSIIDKRDGIQAINGNRAVIYAILKAPARSALGSPVEV